MPQPPSTAIYYQARRSENLISPTACSRNSPSFGIFPLHNILPRVASLLLLSHPVPLPLTPTRHPFSSILSIVSSSPWASFPATLGTTTPVTLSNERHILLTYVVENYVPRVKSTT